EERRRKKRDPDLREKIFLRRRIDQSRVGTGSMLEGHHQNIVDVLGEIEGDDEHHYEGGKRLDEPRAQLDQMIHQGRFRRLDISVGHGWLVPEGMGYFERFLKGIAQTQ